MPERTIENFCFWFTFRKGEEVQPPLKGDHETDIAIIGGGFTGLWSAYFIKQLDPGARVTLLEQGVLGYGASGRSGGMTCGTLDQSHGAAIEHFGLEEAVKMARVAELNYAEFSEFAHDCDFEPVGFLHPALMPQHMEAYEEESKAAESVGAPKWRLLSAGEIRAELDSRLYLGGAHSTEGGSVNPMKVVLKLKREVERAGVQIFENTKVERLRPHDIITLQGRVRAKKIILATDAYGHYLAPKLGWKYLPLYDYIIVSEPLTPEQFEKIGWRNRQGISDARTFFNYYRLTADNRILWGTSEARYYPPNEVHSKHDYSEQYRDALHKSFFAHFPQLSDLSFPYAWGGPIAATTRLSPCFGSFHGGSTFYALGYTGQGVVCSRFAGEVLAHKALERSSPFLELAMVRKAPLSYPPEPLRRFAVSLVRNALHKVDRGEKPGLLLKALELFNIEFSS